MSGTDTLSGGFAGDPAEAPTVAGTGGCCGNPPPTTLTLAEPAAGGPCCGSQADATAENTCCGSAAKAGAVAAGRGCCG
jgi:hypothetical protein